MKQPLIGLIITLLSFSSWAQEIKPLTLQEALERTKQNNGTLISARLNFQSARSSVASALANFYPTITPQYRYVDQEQQFSGNFTGTGRQSFSQVSLSANWVILDAGQRDFALQRTRRLATAVQYSTLWTLRQVLFTVTRQFYDALRAQELLRVADAQVERARQALEVIREQVEVGAAARKDILQAEADYQNAIVQQISARNQLVTTQAVLKATIGWPPDQPLPPLQAPENPSAPPTTNGGQELTLESAIQQGLEKRPDLLDARQRLAAERYNVLSAERQTFADWTLSLNFSRIFEPRESQNRSLTFVLSYPLFDAGRSREVFRQARLAYEASQAQLQQQERGVRSEIESTYLTWKQNLERLQASEIALKAAQLNYEAATESQRLGAAGILDVTNARFSLVTAETNYVQALYDYYIAEVQLRLAIGEPMPGETI
ncbi:MAG: TolC family protein [Candidatus Caldarchaeum sp.]